VTQCEHILSMLRAAGKRGVRSDEFFRVGLPRGVARIYDLRKQGYEIDAEPEGKYKRFRLVGIGAEGKQAEGACVDGERDPGLCQTASQPKPFRVDSGERFTGGRERAEIASGAFARSVPSMFDLDADWNAA
jgi:Helix-turn-helix domain